MYVVMGAAGHVGSAVLRALQDRGEPVLALVHSVEKAKSVAGGQVEALVVDVGDSAGLRAAFAKGRRAFLLNPPASPQTDTNAQELGTARSIAEALKGSGLEKVALASTYGAQDGDGVGDLSVLFALERLVEASGIPCAINRGAYYFTNLDMLAEPAREGVLPTAFPKDFEMPMVSPEDLGRAAAERLTSGTDDVGIVHVEGPERYSFDDVASAFATKFGRGVDVQTIPPEAWVESFEQVGFSPSAARSYARMTRATIDGAGAFPSAPRRVRITLAEHVARL